MSTKRVIGVDIGGTKVLAGIVDEHGQVHETLERPTVTTSQAALLEALADQVLSLPQDGIEAVGSDAVEQLESAARSREHIADFQLIGKYASVVAHLIHERVGMTLFDDDQQTIEQQRQ